MTREELDRLAELLAKATPGRWLVRAERHRFIHVYAGGGGIAHMAQTDGEAAANARLTVELHNAAPALLAAAREAEELREWQREAAEWFRGELDRSRATEGILRALLARVKP